MLVKAGINLNSLVMYFLPASEDTSQFRNSLASGFTLDLFQITQLLGTPVRILSPSAASSPMGIGRRPSLILGLIPLICTWVQFPCCIMAVSPLANRVTWEL
ncbi:hypothetical protein D3C75_1217320 [compost metagenome]